MTGVNVFEFNVCSTLHIVVERTSSVTDLLPSTAYIAFLQLFTNCSHAPPKWGAAGGLNFHLTPRWIRCSSIPSLFNAATYSANSFSAPTKFVSLSLMIVLGSPLSRNKPLYCFVAGLCLLNARCMYATLFTSLLKLLNRSHWITAFFSSACIMKTDENIFSSPDAMIRFTCSGHSLSDCLNQAGPVSHSLFLSFAMLIALVPISAGLLIPLTCFHCIQYLSHSIGHKHLFTMGTVYPLQYCSWVWPKTATINLHFMFLEYLFLQLHCHDCRL